MNCDFSERGANGVYSVMEHPRYGLIQSVVAIRNITAGEELFVDYGYREFEFPSDFLW